MKRRRIHAELLHGCRHERVFFFKEEAQHFWKFAFSLRVEKTDSAPPTCALHQSSHPTLLQERKRAHFPKCQTFPLLNPEAAVAQSLTASRTLTSCCAASSRAGGSAGGQSRTTVPLLTDLKLLFSASRGGRNRCKPLRKRATSSSIWSV